MEQDDLEAGERTVGKTARELRLAREAAALRANLRKRKEQARAREVGGDGDDGGVRGLASGEEA